MTERRFKIEWVRRTDANEPWLTISEMGGIDEVGATWTMTHRDLIEQLWLGRTAFVRRGGGDVDVIIVRESLNECFALEDGTPLPEVFPERPKDENGVTDT